MPQVTLVKLLYFSSQKVMHLNSLEFWRILQKTTQSPLSTFIFLPKNYCQIPLHCLFLFEDIALFSPFRQTEKWVGVPFDGVQIITCVTKLFSLRNAWPEAEK